MSNIVLLPTVLLYSQSPSNDNSISALPSRALPLSAFHDRVLLSSTPTDHNRALPYRDLTHSALPNRNHTPQNSALPNRNRDLPNNSYSALPYRDLPNNILPNRNRNLPNSALLLFTIFPLPFSIYPLSRHHFRFHAPCLRNYAQYFASVLSIFFKINSISASAMFPPPFNVFPPLFIVFSPLFIYISPLFTNMFPLFKDIQTPLLTVFPPPP